MSKGKITFVFDDEKDAKELIASLEKYNDILWNNETKVAMIKVFKKEMQVLVSKSVYQAPKPLRL